MLRAYLQLFRLPNVFTAMADVLMGYGFTHGAEQMSLLVCGLLVASSSLLYTAGMVLNDVYDADVDAKERPFRPIPSGRVSQRFARWLGYELLIVGTACGWLAGMFDGQWRSTLVAVALAGAVVAYDAWLKRTPLAPLGMGLCRGLNVLLGMSAFNGSWEVMHFLIAAGVAIYIVGVTWFSRQEAETSKPLVLLGATGVMAAGIALLAGFPALSGVEQPERVFPGFGRLGMNWYFLWGLLGLSILYRALAAVADPSPGKVQYAVKHAILSLIVLDAAVVLSMREVTFAFGIFALLIPSRILGRWLYST